VLLGRVDRTNCGSTLDSPINGGKNLPVNQEVKNVTHAAASLVFLLRVIDLFSTAGLATTAFKLRQAPVENAGGPGTEPLVEG
jgi:hypothetical protein